jgi:hypothetical protein
MKHTIYPFVLSSIPDASHCMYSYHVLAGTIWERVKDHHCPWFTLGLEVRSPKQIFLNVYDMNSTITGGIGNLIKTVKIDVLTDEEKKVLQEEIDRLELECAERELVRLENEERLQRIRALREQMFGNNLKRIEE